MKTVHTMYEPRSVGVRDNCDHHEPFVTIEFVEDECSTIHYVPPELAEELMVKLENLLRPEPAAKEEDHHPAIVKVAEKIHNWLNVDKEEKSTNEIIAMLEARLPEL